MYSLRQNVILPLMYPKASILDWFSIAMFLFLKSSFRCPWSLPALILGLSAAAWPIASSCIQQSCSQMAPMPQLIPISQWPFTLLRSFSTANQPASHTMNCCTPANATWGTSVWWMLTGYMTLPLNTSAGSSEQPRMDLKIGDKKKKIVAYRTLGSWLW